MDIDISVGLGKLEGYRLISLDAEAIKALETVLTGVHLRGLALPSRLRKKNKVLDFVKELLDKIEEVKK